jgi:hypothetical protein
MSAISSQISDWPCSPLLSEEHQLSSPALAKCSVCELGLEKLRVCGHNPLSAFEQLRHRVLHLENLAPRALTITQAPQSGGGRSTANLNKNTDEFGRWLTGRPIRRETSPNTSKSSPTTLPNRAAKPGADLEVADNV